MSLSDRERWEAMRELEPIIGKWLDKPETQRKIGEALDRGVEMRKRFAKANYVDPDILREPLE